MQRDSRDAGEQKQQHVRDSQLSENSLERDSEINSEGKQILEIARDV